MAREERRRQRAWVRVQLGADDESLHAAQIIAFWRASRKAAQNIKRAIALYYALLSGDTDLLWQWFPLLMKATSGGRSIISSAPIELVDFGNIEVRDAQSSGDELGDFMNSLGLD